MDNSVLKFADLIGSDETFDQILNNIRLIKKELKDLAKVANQNLASINPNDEKAIEAAIKDVNELTKAKKVLEEQEKTTLKTKKKLNELTEEELILREKQKIENRERVQRAKQLAILQKAEIGSIEALRAELSLTTIQWKKLGDAERQSTKEGKELVKEKKRLTEQLKRLEKQTGDTRRNVGNYTDSLGRLGRTAARIFVGRSIVDGIKRIGSALVSITQDGAGVSKELANIQKAGTRFVNILTGAGAKLLETFGPAITKIINLFSFVLEKISQTSQETGFLGDAFRAVGDVINGVVNIFFDLPAIFGGVVSAGRQLASNIQTTFSKLGLRLQILFENIEKANPFSNRSTAEIDRNIARLRNRIDRINNSQIGVVDAFKSGFDAVKKEQEEFEKKQGDLEKLGEKIRGQEKARTGELEKQNKLVTEQNQLLNTRIQAIEALQKELLQIEAENIQDRQEQAFRLEALRFKEEQKQREKNFDEFVSLLEKQEELVIEQFGKNSKEVLEFRKNAAKELLELEEFNLKLEQEQLQRSENNKLKIRKEFAIKAQEQIQPISSSDDSFQEDIKSDLEKAQDEINAFQASQDKAEADRIAKTKERTQQLFENIAATSQKVSAEIQKVFDKQAEVAGELVEDQAEAVEAQRQRAEQGLDNTLKFEQEQLAKREAEQVRAEQRAKQAAEILTLLNLVSAYAASGDENALSRALVDFGIIKGLSAGFKDGGYTGDAATDAISGHVHGQEYVVTAENTKKFGLVGKTGDQFGEAMSDYFNQTSPLLNNNFGKQRSDFEGAIQVVNNNVDFGGLQSEFVKLRKSFERIPRTEVDVVWLTDYVIELTEKTIRGKMTKVNQQTRRLNGRY